MVFIGSIESSNIFLIFIFSFRHAKCVTIIWSKWNFNGFNLTNKTVVQNLYFSQITNTLREFSLITNSKLEWHQPIEAKYLKYIESNALKNMYNHELCKKNCLVRSQLYQNKKLYPCGALVTNPIVGDRVSKTTKLIG